MALPNLNTIILGAQFIGIELFCYNSQDGVAILTVEKKKDELIILNREKRSSLDKLVGKPNKDTPVFITINNNQVIQKELEFIDSSDSKVLHKAFANIKIEDFYYQIWQYDGKSIVAICRKSYIEDLIKELSEKSIIPTGISLGVCGCSQIINFIENDSIKTNSQIISREEQSLIRSAQDALVTTYNVNGLEIQSTYLLSFCGILQKIVPNNTLKGNINLLNEVLYHKFYQESFFKKGLKTIVFTLLIILLVNFFFFNYYYKKALETSSSVLANKELIDKINQTKNRLKIKESKLKNSTNSFDSKSSYFINEIVKNIPNSILLNELIYHPLEKNIKENQPIQFQNDVLLISGKTINVSELTNWFEEIEKKNWVKNTSIVHFGKNENNESIFSLKINLNSNEVK